MTYLNSIELMKVAEELYYHQNPGTKMDVPSAAYEIADRWYKQYVGSNSELSFFDWCIDEKQPKKEKDIYELVYIGRCK